MLITRRGAFLFWLSSSSFGIRPLAAAIPSPVYKAFAVAMSGTLKPPLFSLRCCTEEVCVVTH